jgi:beta-galactosidase
VETLNREWGLVYWSHRLSTWADLWVPDGNVQPQYDLAWRRFQAAQTTEFIGWQAEIVREYARPDQFVTTCLSYARPALADDQLMARLDVTAGNPYYEMQDGLAAPARGDARVAGRPWTTSATWSLYLTADRMFSSRQEPFLITETNASSIGMPWTNKPAFDGQWRQAAWALVSRGASMIEYWHWHTLHYGAETYWGGVLPHSGRPGRTYREVARIGADFESAGDLLAGIRPDADVTMLYSAPSKWAMEFAPHLATPDGGPDRRAYDGFFDPFYRGAFEAGLQVGIVHDSQVVGEDPADFADRRPVLVVPGLYIADDATLDWLVAYAEAGGHLVLGPRTGYGDEEARARAEVAPARLSEAAGAWYEEFTNLAEPVPVVGPEGSPLDLSHATGTRWADGLEADGAQILARYDHPHHGRWAAATTRQHGNGRITYVGTLPDPSFARSLLRWAAPTVDDRWRATDASVTSTSATSLSGARLRFLHNWSWRTVALAIPAAARDVVSGARLAQGDELELGPWDVRILVEEADR